MKIIKILGVIISLYWFISAMYNKNRGNVKEAIWDMCWLIVLQLAILM